MKDPIGSFETIKENFIRYVETAFGTRYEGLERERYALLNKDKVFYRKPWMEPLPDYLSSNKKIDDLSLDDLGNALCQSEVETFKSLVKTGLFPGFGKLHYHQAEMLKEALRGNNCIITSGTGSGKTESFLLPLFAQLAKELSGWSRPNAINASSNSWWKERANGGLTPSQIVDSNYQLSQSARQRAHETRPIGVRALILYPMNALVEDQMSRLRKALDSDDTRQWITSTSKSNTIYFGRYNGSSPVPGELFKTTANGTVINTAKVNKLKKALSVIEDNFGDVQNYIDNHLPNDPAFQQLNTTKQTEKVKELKSFFQRLDGAEMRCRFDMQIAPPDILITNYSMLSIMLMRQVDSGIFDHTKAWLDCDDLPEAEREAAKSNRIFHLIIDELHLYRGTQGTEVAYLLKLVLNRLGLHPHHPQLRILASSASLEPGDQNSLNFLGDFFGIDNNIKPFKIIEGKSNPVEPFSQNELRLPVTPFKNIALAFERSKGDISTSDFITSCEAATRELSTGFNIPVSSTGLDALLTVASNPLLKLKERMYQPCMVSDGQKVSYKAVCSLKANGDDSLNPFFAETVFGNAIPDSDLEYALRGLLIVRAMFDEPGFEHMVIAEDRKLPRFRFHYFFRNIEGIWASVKADDLNSTSYSDPGRTAGELYSSSRINSRTGHRVLELLYCDNCGTTLFGGSRLVTRNKSQAPSFELLPISPNIEGIPEKTPAKLVEKRSFQEYAVFWPQGNQQFTPHDIEQGIPQNYWRQTTVNGYSQNEYEANWVEASLNNISGDIDFTHDKANEEPQNWIKGYYFIITRENSNVDICLPSGNGEISTIETHRALPNVCPSCGINHQRRNNNSRKAKTTSIRGFRTGFAKTTQMFAKELMYQLPDNEAERKLVVFSDSREDAAQVSNGIERNHFTDLLREILVDELHKRVLAKYNVLSAFDANATLELDRFREVESEAFTEIEGMMALSNLPGNNAVIVAEKNKATAQLERIRQKMFSVRELVDITNSLNLAPLVKHVVKLGINPGGNDIAIQSRLLNSSFVPWYELIDFTNYEWTSGADQTFINDLKEGAFSNLASMFFGSLFYSFESSALGYVTINPGLPVIAEQAGRVGIGVEDFLQILNAVIRILGDKRKHNKNDDADPFNFIDYNRLPGHVKKYVRAIASNLSKTENELGSAVYDTLSQARLVNGATGLIIEELFIKVATADNPVWISERANRPHLHFSGGFCTYSLSPFTVAPQKRCDDIWGSNYLSYNAIKEQRKPIRLHCEELTGQTDDQFERQRHFRNIILPDEGNKQVKTIDLLSVTTTLEVGVDIGALQAVMLGNMPPQRFNYQQRVGRAGRRGQAYSVILTFCRGRSHDEFYFSNPYKITNDSPPTPFLTMNQERIFKRLLAKEILRRAYLTIPTNVNNDEEKPSVHGEFGNTNNWTRYKEAIIEWVEGNQSEIRTVVSSLVSSGLNNRTEEFVNWVTDTTSPQGLIAKSQSIIDNEEIATNDISEKLAEGGILPMFGMPTTVKNLYHGIKRDLEEKSIDRPQSMAIYEFAPGAQKTKDKAIHTVIGFTSDFVTRRQGQNEIVTNTPVNNNLPFSLNRWFVRCRSCGYFETYSDETKTQMEAQNLFVACPNCGEQDESRYHPPIKLKAPRAYRTNLSLGSDLREDSEIILSRPPIFAEKIDDPNNPDSNKTVNNASLTISDKDVTWRVNTNSDNYFTGRLANTTNAFPFAHSFRFTNQWIAQNVIDINQLNPFNENGYSYRIYPEGELEQIALASSKKTEIFRIRPASIALDLDLNMFSRESDPPSVKAQANGVRSGFYSAAFLLQRILADKLDVDPTEIEIADISLARLPDGTRTAEIVLTDELPNGSGFVRYLYNNFEELINEAVAPNSSQTYLGKIHSANHSHTCKDACYECLKVYRNMNYHSLLDWRMALSMLRVLHDSAYTAGADGNFNSYIELNSWPQFATELRDSFANSFGFNHSDEINGLPIIKFGRRQKNIIAIIHPFWNYRDTKVANWLSEIKAEIEIYLNDSGGTLSLIDTFNLHRRPGWCYEKLVDKS